MNTRQNEDNEGERKNQFNTLQNDENEGERKTQFNTVDSGLNIQPKVSIFSTIKNLIFSNKNIDKDIEIKTQKLNATVANGFKLLEESRREGIAVRKSIAEAQQVIDESRLERQRNGI